MRRKFTAWLLTIMMIATMMPTSVFADDSAAGNSSQIGSYYEVDDKTGKLPATPSLAEGKTEQSYADGNVKVNKTIESTGTENEFKIKLSVSTTENIAENVTSPDVATVIVIDTSGSMNSDSKLDNAKKAAQTFINDYVDTTGQSTRKIAIVRFSGSRSTTSISGASTVQAWTDVENIATRSDNVYCTAINNLRAQGGTNIEAGLILAKNLLSQELKNKDGEVITNKNVILLSDGNPTLGVTDSEERNTSTTAICSTTTYSNTYGNAEDTTCETHEDITGLVTTLKGMGVTPYAVYVGNGYIDCEDCSLNKKVGDWLGDCGFTAYSTTGAGQITSLFETILEIIELKAQAWEVTDPMGSNIAFETFNQEPNPANEFVETNGTIDWDIKSGSIPVKVETINGETVRTYELEYTIKLDNLTEGFEAGKEYATNGVTSVSYLVTKSENGQMSYENGDAYFNIPSVKGQDADFSFTKVDSLTSEALAGATFTLTTSDKAGWSMEATSGKDGVVSFVNVPSGHTYTLTETTVPEGYEAVGPYTVTVSNGQVIADFITSGKLADPSKTTTISGSKTWDDNNDQDGIRPDAITVKLLADGKEVATQTVTEKEGWAWSFENMPTHKNGEKITYTVEEIAVEGYTTKEDGYNFTNSHTPEVIDIPVKKIWEDNDDQDGKRPEAITVTLYANGEEVSKATLEDKWIGAWSHKFENLPKYKDGKEIVYTVSENVTNDYKSNIESKDGGFVITNTHEPETVEVSGTKVWNDADDQDGKRPASIEISLLADGKEAATEQVAVGEDGTWTWTFTELPKYKNHGEEIVYTVAEVKVPEGYESAVTGDAETGFTVTNTYEPETVSVEGKKTWDDNDNQDGVRPVSITVRVLADGAEVANKTVTEKDGWAWSFTELPKYRDHGTEIVYTVTEDAIEGYSAVDYDGYNVTNKDTPDQTSVTVTKAWNDTDNQDGIRPNSVTVQLKADGEAVDGKTLVLNEDNKWTGTFTELDKYRDKGTEIEYTIEEVKVPEGYESVITGDAEAGFTVTNTYEPETVSVEGEKIWNDNNDQDGKRPEAINVNLYADEELIATKTVEGEGNNWSWSFTDLPKYKNHGIEIGYTVAEVEVTDGYTSKLAGDAKAGYEITNTYEPETVEVSGTKVWNDANDQDGNRPASIEISLLADGEKVADKQVSVGEDGTWSWKFTDLPKYKNHGEEIVYTVAEVEVPEGYESAVTGDAETGFTVTNTYEPETTKVEGKKTWDDNDNQDGVRPTAITVRLLADGVEVESKTVTEKEGWAWSFTELPKYRDQGVEIVYTVTEDAITGYSAVEYDGYNVINKDTPDQTSVTVTKAWNDADDQDGVRPDLVTVQLKADGEAVDGKTLVLNKDNKWTGSFTELPKYKDKGKEIEYTIEEVNVPEGYESVITGDAKAGFTVTNTYEPETIEVEGEKVWSDADDQDGVRPEEITVNLLADGEVVGTKTVSGKDWSWSFTELPKYKDHGKEIKYTVAEADVPEGYESVVTGNAETGFTVTNTYEPETVEVSGTKVWNDADDQDGIRAERITVKLLADGKEIDTQEVTAESDWSWSFTNLPKYRDQGTEIEYTIAEESVDGYEAKVDGFNITNTHTPETTKVEGEKTWVDADNQDGIRPDSITVKLLADGEEIDTQEVTAENNWSWSFTDLPKFKTKGVEIEYTVAEESVDGYSAKVDGFDITNTHTPETTKVEGEKTWVDADNQDGIRPDSITVKLFADGEEIDKQEVTAENNWSWSFTELPKYKAEGVEIEYTIAEESVDGYEAKVDGFDVTNTHTPETTKVEGEKIWKDKDDQDGDRPDSITVRLLADGEEISSKAVTEEDGWAWSFTDLPKYKLQGVEIVYTVIEDTVNEYSTTYDKYDVINTHTPDQTSVTVVKEWDDEGDQDGIRPDAVTVQLMADGTAVKGKTLELNEDNNWTGSFTELDKYRAKGTEIVYTVEELEVKGYETEITGSAAEGFKITNKHETATVEAEGKKVWKDNNDQDGVRPESITVKLLADGVEVDSKTVTAEDDWAWKFTDLPKYKEHGTEIEYSFAEIAVEKYDTSIEGNVITNTHKIAKTEVDVIKIWNDEDDQDGIRPDSVTVQLMADGKAVEGKTLELSNSNRWRGTFEELDKYRDKGTEIVYTVEELEVEGYTVEITGSAEDGYKVTNTHKPATVDVDGKKVWKDNDDQDGVRPESITVKLLADDKEIDSKTVTAEDNWAWKFTDLPKYKAQGTEIEYSFAEIAVDNYTTTVEGNVITNTYEVVKTEVKVAKVWSDADDQDGLRPDSVTVELYADGKATGKTQTLSDKNEWKAVFEDLNKYRDKGIEIAYTVEEVDVPEGYTKAVTGNAEVGFTVINSYTPEITAVKGEKVWNDNSDQDGKRPDTITVRLLADGKEVAEQTVSGSDDTWSYVFNDLPVYRDHGEKIVYTVSEDKVDEYSVEIDGTTIINTHEIEKTSAKGSKTWDDVNNQDGVRPEAIVVNLLANGEIVDTIKVTEADNWSWEFTNLDKYDNGKEIVYSFSEEVVDDYSVSYDNNTIINTYAPEKTSVTVSKTWNDENDRDGIRPDSVTVVLLADGVETNKTVELSDDNNWIASFENLDKYRDQGIEIEYTVTEVAVDGYDAAITGTAETGFNIENTHEPDKTSISGSKTWDDADDQDGKRPFEITVNLLANGVEIDQAVVGADDDWSWKFDDLYVYENGKEIIYTVEEDIIEGYTSVVNGYDITNTHEIELTELTITKGWLDEKKSDRPDSITVNVLADGEVCRTVVITEENGWTCTVTDLPKYVEGMVGVEVVYSVEEIAVEGYTTEIAGFDITNIKIPPQVTPEPPTDDGGEDDGDNNNNETKTGDNMNIMALAGTALAALAAAFAAIFRRKRNA